MFLEDMKNQTATSLCRWEKGNPYILSYEANHKHPEGFNAAQKSKQSAIASSCINGQLPSTSQPISQLTSGLWNDVQLSKGEKPVGHDSNCGVQCSPARASSLPNTCFSGSCPCPPASFALVTYLRLSNSSKRVTLLGQ